MNIGSVKEQTFSRISFLIKGTTRYTESIQQQYIWSNYPAKKTLISNWTIPLCIWSFNNNIQNTAGIQGIPLQTVKSNLALREGRKDISDILWHFFVLPHYILHFKFNVKTKKIGQKLQNNPKNGKMCDKRAVNTR